MRTGRPLSSRTRGELFVAFGAVAKRRADRLEVKGLGGHVDMCVDRRCERPYFAAGDLLNRADELLLTGVLEVKRQLPLIAVLWRAGLRIQEALQRSLSSRMRQLVLGSREQPPRCWAC